MTNPEMFEPLLEIGEVALEHGVEIVTHGPELLEMVGEGIQKGNDLVMEGLNAGGGLIIDGVKALVEPIDLQGMVDAANPSMPNVDLSGEPEETSMHSTYVAHEDPPPPPS